MVLCPFILLIFLIILIFKCNWLCYLEGSFFNCLWADSYTFAIWRIYFGEEFQWFVSKFWVQYSASAYWAHPISGSDQIECWIINLTLTIYVAPYLLMSCAFLLYSRVTTNYHIYFFFVLILALYPCITNLSYQPDLQMQLVAFLVLNMILCFLFMYVNMQNVHALC